jgi:hypothetical protein
MRLRRSSDDGRDVRQEEHRAGAGAVQDEELGQGAVLSNIRAFMIA